MSFIEKLKPRSYHILKLGCDEIRAGFGFFDGLVAFLLRDDAFFVGSLQQESRRRIHAFDEHILPVLLDEFARINRMNGIQLAGCRR